MWWFSTKHVVSSTKHAGGFNYAYDEFNYACRGFNYSNHTVGLTIQRLSGKVSRLVFPCAQAKQLLPRLTELAAEVAAAGDVKAVKKHSKHKRRCPVWGVISEQNRSTRRKWTHDQRADGKGLSKK